jgi:hypothetical protein
MSSSVPKLGSKSGQISPDILHVSSETDTKRQQVDYGLGNTPVAKNIGGERIIAGGSVQVASQCVRELDRRKGGLVGLGVAVVVSAARNGTVSQMPA